MTNSLYRKSAEVNRTKWIVRKQRGTNWNQGILDRWRGVDNAVEENEAVAVKATN